MNRNVCDGKKFLSTEVYKIFGQNIRTWFMENEIVKTSNIRIILRSEISVPLNIHIVFFWTVPHTPGVVT
jgi:hypothetical protein